MYTDQLTVLQPFEKGLTKSEIKSIANDLVINLMEGGDPLRMAEAVSAMELLLKELKDNPEFKSYVREEAEKYPKGFVSKSGAKIELAEVGIRYDFTSCGDTEWEMLDAQMKSLKEKIAEREKFLKNLPGVGIEQLNKETGEMITIYPPSKTSTSSYKITLAK
ncbi:MAG: hypothetical protein LC100_11245 [Chitinophagales bacterium]|nr:hypothetical protein [Chitinophagales bacterium]